MSKKLQNQLGILLLDMIVISGLVYGGLFSWISLAWLWLAISIFSILLTRGKISKYFKVKKSIAEISILLLGSIFVLCALYLTGHEITLVAMAIVDMMILSLHISNNRKLKES